MSEDSQRAERQRILEEKRRKLEKLKRDRAEKDKAAAEAAAAKAAAEAEADNVDRLVDSILGSKNVTTSNIEGISSRDMFLSSQIPVEASSSSSSSGGDASSSGPLSKNVNLSMAMKICHIDIPPRPVEKYEKSSQTDIFEFDYGDADQDTTTALDGLTLSPSRQGQGINGSNRRLRLSSGSNHDQSNSHHRPVGGSSPRGSAGGSHNPTESSGGESTVDEVSSSMGGHNSNHNSPRHMKKTIMSSEEEEAWNNGGREAVLKSESFSNFVSKSSRLVERAISQASSFDILMNVTTSGHEGTKRHSDMLTDISLFECDYLKGRPVMDIQFSPHADIHQDVFLVAYGSIGQASLGPDGKPYIPTQTNGSTYNNDTSMAAMGVVCLWHSAVTSSPEKKLFAPSPVLATRFHSDDQNLVLGSCYNGQILLWDLRLNSSMPVQRSNLAGKGHKHPVYSMSMSSTAASYELITVSTDGYLCHWDLQRLADPISYVTLQLPQAGQFDITMGMSSSSSSTGSTGSSSVAGTNTSAIFNTLSVTSTVLGHNETQKEAIFGSENGHLYRVSLPYRTTDPITQIDAHKGLVSSMHRNPHGGKFCKDLLLTSSLDWTVKLWNTLPSSFHHQNQQALLEVVSPSYDYICDVQWSPVNPTLFSTITSGGILTLWDLSKSTLEAQDSFHILKDQSPMATTSNSNNNNNNNNNNNSVSSGIVDINHGLDGHLCALNKLVWSVDGNSLYVGDTKGNVRQIAVKESAARSRPGDEGRMQMLLNAKKAVDESNLVDINDDNTSGVQVDDV